MTTMVIGASGATGKLLVEQILNMGHKVKIIVRPSSNIPLAWVTNDRIKIIKANILEINTNEMANYLKDCQAIVSCLGHNLTIKGIYGKPRKLITGAIELLCNAVIKNTPDEPVKFVLMNTTGVSNKNINEPISIVQKIVMVLIRFLIPPQLDNEDAVDILRIKIGQDNPFIKWVVVRPDTLINNDSVTDYDLHESPTRSAVFNPGKTSRINVGHFLSSLINDNKIWNEWTGKMPVIYNR